MFSFSAVSAAPSVDMGLPDFCDGSVWHHSRLPQMRFSHRHAELEINLVTAGRAAYLLGDRRYDLARNTLVWLFPGQDHILLDESPDYAMWLGIFKPRLIQRVCTTADTAVLGETDPPGFFCRRISESGSARLRGLFEELTEAGAETALGSAGLGYLLLSAWSAYGAAEVSAIGPDVHPSVEQAARLLRDESETLTVAQIAALVGLSASRLSRLFHAQTGIALVDFRNRQRLQRFLTRLERSPHETLLDAALEAGFGSYPQFHRIFTRQMGCSPGDYRAEFLSGRNFFPGGKKESPGAAANLAASFLGEDEEEKEHPNAQDPDRVAALHAA